MPLPPHVLLGTERSRRGRSDGNRFTRWLRRSDRRPAAVAATPAAEPAAAVPRGTQVDAGTRAFWAGSETANVTSRRAAALVDAHERGHAPLGSRPPGNPDCQLSWGSPEAFAEAQGASAMRRLRGVSVKEVRYLPEWTETSRGRTYRDVAELDVEYEVGDPEPVARIRRVVHLVPGGGRWRSICYPM